MQLMPIVPGPRVPTGFLSELKESPGDASQRRMAIMDVVSKPRFVQGGGGELKNGQYSLDSTRSSSSGKMEGVYGEQVSRSC
jgi:hypothetical protein